VEDETRFTDIDSLYMTRNERTLARTVIAYLVELGPRSLSPSLFLERCV